MWRFHFVTVGPWNRKPCLSPGIGSDFFLFVKEIIIYLENVPSWEQPLTVFATSVEIFHIVVEADSDGGEAHLSLQTCHQPVVQRLGPLRSDHGADRPKHASVTDAFHSLLLSLNLGSQFVLKANNHFYTTKCGKPFWLNCAALSNRSDLWVMKWKKLKVNLLSQ